MHLHGPFAHRYDLIGLPVDGHNGRLIYHDLVMRNDEGVGGTKVDGYVLRQKLNNPMQYFFMPERRQFTFF